MRPPSGGSPTSAISGRGYRTSVTPSSPALVTAELLGSAAPPDLGLEFNGRGCPAPLTGIPPRCLCRIPLAALTATRPAPLVRDEGPMLMSESQKPERNAAIGCAEHWLFLLVSQRGLTAGRPMGIQHRPLCGSQDTRSGADVGGEPGFQQTARGSAALPTTI